MATTETTDVVAGNAIRSTKEEANEPHCSSNEGEKALHRQLNQMGQHFADWDPNSFRRIVSKHAKKVLDSKDGLIGLFISALSTVGSAGLNMWYLFTTATDLQRDKSEDYNLTEWIVVMFEVIIVYIYAAITLSYFCRLLFDCCANNPAGIMVAFTEGLKIVGRLSAFEFLKLLTIGNLKGGIFALLDALNRLVKKTRSILATILAIDWNSVVPVFLHFQPNLACFCGCCPWFLPLYPVLTLALTVGTFAAEIGFFLAIGPAALLLKIRQVSFVLTHHIQIWSVDQYFSFFGFANNVAALSASEPIRINSYMTVLGMNVGPKRSDDDEKHGDEKSEEEPRNEHEKETDVMRENASAHAGHIITDEKVKDEEQVASQQEDEHVNAAGRPSRSYPPMSVEELMACALLDEGLSHFKVWLIMNSWGGDPDQYIKLLKGDEPTNDNTNDKETDVQLTAHVDLAKPDVVETQTVDAVGGVGIDMDSENMV